MNRVKFIQTLRKHLSELPAYEVEKSVNYFNEMIDDRIEEGMTEEEAVADIGDVRLVAERILDEERPLLEQLKSQIMPKKGLSGWVIALLILGAPLWLSLLLAAGLLFLAVCLIALAVWVVALAFTVQGGATIISSLFRIGDGVLPVLATLSVGLIMVGLGILLLPVAKSFSQFLFSWLGRFRKKG